MISLIFAFAVGPVSGVFGCCHSFYCNIHFGVLVRAMFAALVSVTIFFMVTVIRIFLGAMCRSVQYAAEVP
jgi:hypothetical protein